MSRDEEQQDSFLPPFANQENRKLDADVRDLEKQLELAEVAMDENSDRVNIMQEHLKNVQLELKYTQSRVETKAKEIETENHLKSLAERENGRLRQDVGKLGKERAELEAKMTSLQTAILTNNDKMNQFKELMNWNQEELDQWALAQRQKEEDNNALAKYRTQDAAKVKELEQGLEKMSRTVVQRKQELDNEVIETQAAQIQLDKAAEDFRKLHTERQDLVRQWDEAVAAMRQRDMAIQAASQAFADKKTELRAKQGDLDGQARFLADEAANNKEIDARIAYFDREVAKQRETYQREQVRVEATSSQVDILKATLAKAANDLADGGQRNIAAQQQLEIKKTRLDAARKKSALLKRKMDGEFTQLDTLAAQMDELERMRKAEEMHLSVIFKEKDGFKVEQVKREKKLMELQNKERDLISSISGGQGQNKNMAARIGQLDEQVVRQQELLYNVEFQLQQMERKVARAGGVRSEEETRALNSRIEKLAAMLEGVNAEHSMLLEQVKRSEDDLLKARRANTSLRTEKTKVDETISTLKLENDMVNRQVKSTIEAKERCMVEHDVMKLDVKRLRDMLAMYADEVFSQENRKFQMTMSMQERKQEIEVHREGLRIDLKMIRDDVHRITLELKERALRVEKLQNKFETLSSKNRSVDDEGEQRTQAYYVIKAAQEREELQREGDDLDAKIRRAEKETAALEATLVQLGAANSGYNASFKKVDGGAADQERAMLKDKLDKAYDKLTFKRQEEKQLADDVRGAEGRLSSLANEQRSLAGLADQLMRKKSEGQRGVEEQAEKMQRALRAADKQRAKLGLRPDSIQEKDVELADMRDTTRTMLQELKMLAMQNPGAGILEACESANIKLPAGSTTPSVRSDSRPQSARSNGSMGSAASQRSVGRGGGSPAGSRPMSGASQRSAAARS